MEIPSYNGEVSTIINNSCAYTDCHVTGFSSGDYSSFEKLMPSLGDNFLQEITTTDMPPVYADGPKTLSDNEIFILQCWAQAGYPEN